jgi:hypothetical protein
MFCLTIDPKFPHFSQRERHKERKTERQKNGKAEKRIDRETENG